MSNKFGVDVQANLDPSGIDAGLNKVVNKVNQANRTTYNPVAPKAAKEIEDLHRKLEQLLRVDSELRRRAKATNQIGTPYDQWDMGAMYPNAAARRAKEQAIRRYLYGDDGGGGSGGGGGGGWKKAAAGVAQAGLRATGPAGGVAANAIGTGMSSGFGAGLMGLMGGMLALGVGKVVGAAMEKVGQAEDNAVAMDRLKRTLGDVNVSFAALKSVVHAGADNLKITYAEAGQLSQQFVKLGNVSSDQYKNLADELKNGVGLSRAFGLDPSQGMGVMGQMRGVGVTSNTQESRRFALLIGETIGKSGAFAKADEVMDALASYATSQTRNNLGRANVGGYAGMFAGMVGSGIPGLDPAGAAGILSRVNATLAAGGGAGEASQWFTGRIGAKRGMNVFDTQLWREAGAFGTADGVFGGNGAVSQFYDKFGLKKPRGSETFLDATLGQLQSDYGKDPQLMLNATARQTGLSMTQAASLHLIKKNGNMGEMEQRLAALGVDLSKVSGSGIGNISTAFFGSAGQRAGLRDSFLGRSDVSEADKARLRGTSAGSTNESNVLATLSAQYEQERTQGSDIRDSKNALDNIKMNMADKVVPYLNEMRMGIVHIAGKGEKTPRQIMEEMISLESKDRVKGIEGNFDPRLQGLRGRRATLTGQIEQLSETRLTGSAIYLNNPELAAEKRRERAELQRQLAEVEGSIVKLSEEKAEQLRKENQRRTDEMRKMDAANNLLTTGSIVPGAGAGRGFVNPPTVGGAPRGSGGSGGGSPGDKAAAMKFFMDKGWTREQAAGIVANLALESGMNPGASGDGGAAYGVAQWHPDRQAEFQKWAGKGIRGSSLNEQLGFVHHELTDGKERAAGARLRGATSAGDAGAVVSRYYERPKLVDWEARRRAGLAETIAGTPLPQTAPTSSGAPSAAGGSGVSGEVNVNLGLTGDAMRFFRPAAPPIFTQVPSNWRN